MKGSKGKYVKVIVFECKQKGCTYKWVAGANLGEPPQGARGLRQKKVGGKYGYTADVPSLVLFCPTHGTGLVKSVTKVEIPKTAGIAFK